MPEAAPSSSSFSVSEKLARYEFRVSAKWGASSRADTGEGLSPPHRRGEPMKRKTLKSCEKLLPKKGKHGPFWQRNDDIQSWLSKL
jgi:hypothetical protein